MTINRLALILTLTLLVGTIFAYTTVFFEFLDFFNIYHTVFRVKNCVIPNPVTTPCFYGAFAFLISFFYSTKIRNMEMSRISKHLRNLIFVLIGSNIFAWTNNAIIFYKYFTPSDKIGCSGRPIENPFTTACFIGATLFFAALLIALVLYQALKKPKKS